MSLARTLQSMLITAIISLTSLEPVAHASCEAGQASTMIVMTRTPLSQVEIMTSLRAGHAKVFGSEASDNRLAMAWAQIALETGHGRLTFNHNLGNVSMSSPVDPAYLNNGDKHVYRSFETFADGAEAYWEVLKRCSSALQRFDEGMPTAAATSLKRCHYFEAPVEEYAPTLNGLYKFAHKKVFKDEQREKQERQRRDNDNKRLTEESATANADASSSDVTCGD